MNAELTGIARDVIAEFLCAEKPPLTLRSSLIQNKGEMIFHLSANRYLAFSGRFLLLPLTPVLQKLAELPVVYVVFFYKGRGVYFSGPLQPVKNGFAFVLPQKVFKTPDSAEGVGSVSAKIYVPGISGVRAECNLKKGYDIFDNRLWLGFSKEEAVLSAPFLRTAASLKSVPLSPLCRQIVDKTKRILYIPGKKIPGRNFFPYPVSVTADDLSDTEFAETERELEDAEYDVYIPLALSETESVHTILAFKSHRPMTAPSDVEERLFLLPVCRFLGEIQKNTGAVRGRAEPLSVLCLTHSLIILGGAVIQDSGGFSPPFPLIKGNEYMIHIRIAQARIFRILKIKMAVSKIYKNTAGSVCAVCMFSNIKEEDCRFLYEKFYKTLYK
ncbi:hypothetical protein V1L52_05995 [Treponema sp. HNW]|uniref:hypothetical protein n=1 Tax=Treponema sp. HNW TaxID=3116654 RepID=UPI003D0BD627